MSTTAVHAFDAEHLALAFINDGDIYRKDSLPLIRQLQSDVVRGGYEHNNAPIYWYLLLERNWLHIRTLCGYTSRNRVSEATKFEAARQISDNYKEQIEFNE